jgi:RNA polymerase sigma factor (sigma-70 family)
MAQGQLHGVVRYLRRLTTPPELDGLTDGQLLDRFATRHEETAFAALVQRHGGLVWGVCRGILHDPDDSEDAFQATFLVLVRKARSIGKPESVASWLYGVAYRIAVRAKARSARRQARERQGVAVEAIAPAEGEGQDFVPVLHEEVHRLPEKYRTPVVLCYLQGKSRGEAARQLGWSEGAVKGKLERARDVLRARLARRGVVLSGGILAVPAVPSVPAALAEVTIKAARLVAAGKTAAAGVVSERVAALMEGVLKSMFLAKLKLAVAVALTVAVLGSGAGVLMQGTPAAVGASPPQQEPAPPAAQAPKGRSALAHVASLRDGVLVVIGTEIQEGEQLAPDQVVTVKLGDEVKRYRRLNEGDRVEEGQLLARLDDRLAREEVAIRQAKATAAEADFRAAEKTRDEAQERWNTAIRLRKTGAISNEDYRAARLGFDRSYAEAVSKEQAIEVAKREQRQAEVIVEMHEIRSLVRGVIQTIAKHPGEGVKALETVFRVRIAENRE